MTLSNLLFVVFVDPYQGSNGICLLSSLKICGIFGIRQSNIVPLSLTLQLIGLCGAHRWGDNSYILAKHILHSQTMDPEE
jgi:hypothetical protein